MRTALTIAGSDSSGGAGIQADIKTMTMNGVFAMSAITALTAQNTTGVTGILNSTPEFLAQQLDAVFTDIYPDAVKIGMLPSPEAMECVASKLRQYKPEHIILDPVMVSTSGHRLMESEAEETLQAELFPLAELITPNIPEAEVLTKLIIGDDLSMERACRELFARFHCAVLLKSGHRTDHATPETKRSGSKVNVLTIRIHTEQAARFPARSQPISPRDIPSVMLLPKPRNILQKHSG